MSDVTGGGFPRRDGRRRIVAARDLVAMMLAGVVTGAAAVLVLDGLFAVLGLGEFGQVNGWLAAVLPVMIIVEEFRAWRGVPVRIPVALASAVLGVAAGLLVAGLAGQLPALLSGALGAAAFALVYAVLWFHGIRVAGGRTGEEVT